MLQESVSRKFFKGQGIALGGFIERPHPELIPSQASAAIPVSGGFQSARVEGFNHREIVSFKNAYTIVSGRESPDGKYLETLVTSVVEGLNILGVVTADRVVARLVGSHPNQPRTYPTVTPSGSHFQNLRVGGSAVSFRSIAKAFDQLPNEPGTLEKLRSELPDQVIPGEGWEEKGFLPLALCADLRIEDQQCKSGPNVIEIPHFGRIHLVEFILSRDTHRLTMLRVELGCPARGSVDAGSVEGEPSMMP